MYSSRGGGIPTSVVRLTCDSTAKGGICNVYLIGALPFHPVNSTIPRFVHPRLYPFKDNEEDFLEENEEDFLERNVKVAIESLKPQVVFLGSCPSTVAHDLKQDQIRIVRRLFDQEVIAKFQEVYVFPSSLIFVDECAQYMVSAELLEVAREHTTVVAVVSNSHLPGIQKYWKLHIKVEDLLSGKWPVAPMVTSSVALLLLLYLLK